MKEAVKIDPFLLEKVQILIKDKDKKIIYSSAKQFVNIAVIKLLETEENKKRHQKER